MHEAILVIDIQNDFCTGGSLAVADGESIVVLANDLIQQSSICVLTADWHPQHHASFASSHPGAVPGDVRMVGGIEQSLWPEHCVQGTHGAAFYPALNTDHADLILRKGCRTGLDSYSAFFENDHQTKTGLDGYLRCRNVDAVAIIGLALDYCVAWSAEDACHLGYQTRVILPACRAINRGPVLNETLRRMKASGVRLEETVNQ